MPERRHVIAGSVLTFSLLGFASGLIETPWLVCLLLVVSRILSPGALVQADHDDSDHED